MQQPAFYGPSSGADMLVDAYWVTEELDQADIPDMLIPSSKQMQQADRNQNGFLVRPRELR